MTLEDYANACLFGRYEVKDWDELGSAAEIEQRLYDHTMELELGMPSFTKLYIRKTGSRIHFSLPSAEPIPYYRLHRNFTISTANFENSMICQTRSLTSFQVPTLFPFLIIIYSPPPNTNTHTSIKILRTSRTLRKTAEDNRETDTVPPNTHNELVTRIEGREIKYVDEWMSGRVAAEYGAEELEYGPHFCCFKTNVRMNSPAYMPDGNAVSIRVAGG
ncbi:uncharacterized protein BDR25DRAFT_356880 [Lindgomyces ingoldianus]|uniref:Uncharacterized protein n=1 Tax=Lindgomyces ingoldianus TaxID=673940 RepID=A0ACB6QQC8_9PLEO|nr:uncharacterized protein BDR25DRAFT_356880 [Lindgomyces ingoldianus]KAF2469095.1 hypothetical protein BDR25DRAFT_356880 [Lindgomyces ingoldianus]